MSKKIHIQTPTTYSQLSVLDGLLASQIAFLQRKMIENSQFSDRECDMLMDCIKMLQSIGEMRGELKKKAILSNLSVDEQRTLVEEAIKLLGVKD